MYTPVPREQIADTLIHLRGLFREIPPSNEKGYRARERREILAKNLLSNLFRTKDHPTLHAVLEVADAFSLTLDGAHRLFGYELERIREYDLKLNAGRTQDANFRHIAWIVAYRHVFSHIGCKRQRQISETLKVDAIAANLSWSDLFD